MNDLIPTLQTLSTVVPALLVHAGWALPVLAVAVGAWVMTPTAPPRRVVGNVYYR